MKQFLASLSDTSGHIIECQDKNSKSCDFAPKFPVLHFANNTDQTFFSLKANMLLKGVLPSCLTRAFAGSITLCSREILLLEPCKG